MMKKQTVVALVLLLLIPMVWMLGGLLFSLINPETAAGHANYVRNYHFLSLVKMVPLWAPCGKPAEQNLSQVSQKPETVL